MSPNALVRLQEVEQDILEEMSLREICKRNRFMNSGAVEDFLRTQGRQDLIAKFRALRTPPTPSSPPPRATANPARTTSPTKETPVEQPAKGGMQEPVETDQDKLATADQAEFAKFTEKAWTAINKACMSPKAATKRKGEKIKGLIREIVQIVEDEREEVERLEKIARLQAELEAERAKLKKTKKAVAPRPDDGSSASVEKVRQWARSNGYEVADRGRLSPAIHNAYAAAHQ